MQRLITPCTMKPQPDMADGVCVDVGIDRDRAVSYWYWFSHGVPLADA
ncbi:hypothetical protein [Vreelandella sulfidaeris]|nr:hypothetical protein [Halomonas sulfidaeris]